MIWITTPILYENGYEVILWVDKHSGANFNSHLDIFFYRIAGLLCMSSFLPTPRQRQPAKNCSCGLWWHRPAQLWGNCIESLLEQCFWKFQRRLVCCFHPLAQFAFWQYLRWFEIQLFLMAHFLLLYTPQRKSKEPNLVFLVELTDFPSCFSEVCNHPF